MRLQIPVGLVIGLPDAAEVWLATDGGEPGSGRLTGRPRDGHGNGSTERGRRDGDRDHRT